MKKTSKENIEVILNSDKTSTILSKELNIPASTIRRIRNENGVFLGKIKFNPDVSEFIHMYEILKNSVEMGKHYGVDHHTIAEFSKRIGYDYKKFSPIVTTEDQKQYIINNYHNKSSVEISKKIGVKQCTINGIWNKNKLIGKQRRRYTIDEYVLDKIDNEEKAYFLGFFASDGCVYSSKNKQDTISFQIQKEDGYILDKFYEIFKVNKTHRVNAEGYATFEISSNYICNKIYGMGIFPRKTYGNSFYLLSDELMPHFIRGYFDGDGCITKNKLLSKTCIGISGYRSNMDKFKEYLNHTNILSSFIQDKRKYNSINFDIFGRLDFGNKLYKYCFLKYIYKDATIFLKRKYILSQNFINQIEDTNCHHKISHSKIIEYYKNNVEPQIVFETVKKLEDEDRGGHGSTGRN